MGYDLRKSKVRRFYVKITLDNLQVWGDATEEVVGLFVCQITQAENLTDFVGCEKLFEL